MGEIWAHKLPQYLDKWKVPVLSYEPGWETRSRRSGGWDALFGIGIHHTASKATYTADKTYMWYNSPDRPMGNCLLTRDGTVIIGAAGATNTQGKGGPYATSRGVIPLDAGNRYMYSVEAQNDGIGEVWTAPMQETYPRLCVAVMDWATNETPGVPLNFGDIIAHFEWAPTRKIDPAGPSKWSPNPTGGGSTNKWLMDKFRGSAMEIMFPPTPPAPPDYNFPIPVLKLGSTGIHVTNLQALIKFWWPQTYPYPIDGQFGPKTQLAVAAMQGTLNEWLVKNPHPEAFPGNTTGPMDGVYNWMERSCLAYWYQSMGIKP